MRIIFNFVAFPGGLIYAPRMRRKRYLTMLDPFQQQMGDGVVLLLYVTSLTADILWSASILSALGELINQKTQQVEPMLV